MSCNCTHFPNSFCIAHQEARVLKVFTITANLFHQVHTNHKTRAQNPDTVSIFKFGKFNAGKVASTLQYSTECHCHYVKLLK